MRARGFSLRRRNDAGASLSDFALRLLIAFAVAAIAGLHACDICENEKDKQRGCDRFHDDSPLLIAAAMSRGPPSKP